jgi:hypothetical protein
LKFFHFCTLPGIAHGAVSSIPPLLRPWSLWPTSVFDSTTCAYDRGMGSSPPARKIYFYRLFQFFCTRSTRSPERKLCVEGNRYWSAKRVCTVRQLHQFSGSAWEQLEPKYCGHWNCWKQNKMVFNCNHCRLYRSENKKTRVLHLNSGMLKIIVASMGFSATV